MISNPVCRDLDYVLNILQTDKEVSIICILDYRMRVDDESSFEMVSISGKGQEVALLTKTENRVFDVSSRGNVYFFASGLDEENIELFKTFCEKRRVGFIEYTNIS